MKETQISNFFFQFLTFIVYGNLTPMRVWFIYLQLNRANISVTYSLLSFLLEKFCRWSWRIKQGALWCCQFGRLECDKTYFCNSLSLHTQILLRLEDLLLFILMNLIHWWSPLWYCHVDRRETLQKPGSSSNATSIFLASWKDSTKKQSIYMAFFSFKRYLYQCQTSVNSVIKFMIKFNLYQNNYRYRALNEARTLLPGSISNVACINRLKLTYFVT